MSVIRPLRLRLFLPLTVVGALAAGAACALPAGAAPFTAAQKLAREYKHFNCANAEARITRVQRLEAGFAKGRAKLEAAEARAVAAHDTKRVAFLQKALARGQVIASHLVGQKALSREAQATTIAAGKCHVTPPPTTTTAPAAPATSTAPTAPAASTTTTAPTKPTTTTAGRAAPSA